MSNLTIVIPTFNRAKFLARKLYHLDLQGCNHPIVIVDSSEETTRRQNEETIGQYPNLSIFYHFEDAHFSKKVSFAADLSNTEYTVLSWDDDFLNLRAVDACIGKLGESREFINASGHTLSLFKIGKGTSKAEWLPIYSDNPVFDHDDPFVRVKQFAVARKPKNPLFFVWRTELLQKLLRVVRETDWRKAHETLFDFGSIYEGKTAFIDDVLEARSIDYNRKAYRADALSKFDESGIEMDLLQPDFQPLLTNMVALICDALKRQGVYQGDQTEGKVVGAYLRYRMRYNIGSNTASAAMDSKIQSLFRKLRYAKLLLTPRKAFLLWKIVELYGYHRSVAMYQQDPNLEFNSLEMSSKDSRFYEPFQQIKMAINKFPEI